MTDEPADAVESAAPTVLELNLELLREYLIATNKVATRFAWSLDRISDLMPLDAAKVDVLVDEDEEKLDAFLYRFNALTAMVQDHITRALLTVEEEDARELSKKAQRELMEKLGALKPELGFKTIAELRNKIAHTYPDESAKQAEILNEAYRSGEHLLDAYNGILSYADGAHFEGTLEVTAVVRKVGSHPSP